MKTERDCSRPNDGDFVSGKIAGNFQPTQALWMLMAAIMLVPIVMDVLNLTLIYPAIRWVNIVVVVFVIFFISLVCRTPESHDNFLIGVSLVFNALTVWIEWNGFKPEIYSQRLRARSINNNKDETNESHCV